MMDDIELIEGIAYKKIFEDQKDLLFYLKTFNDIYENAGFHKIDLYWLDKNTLGVKKDSFTSKIPENELHRMALENRLIDVEYKFVDPSKINLYRVRYSVWVRYNSTDKENENYQKLRKILLDDKKNFNIKRVFIN